MPAIGIVFFVGGIFLLRQVIVGRAKETPGDLRDAATSLLSGDTSGFAAVMQRRGSNTGSGTETMGSGAVDGTSPVGSVPSLPSSGSTALAEECIKLGQAAKGYSLGKEGPDYYDCSGLVWAAARNLGIYKGPRFTTATFEHVASKFSQKVSSPQTGDIVIWVSGGHMGVMVGDNLFYSARSPEKGIGVAKLSDDIDYFQATPDYWRVN